MKKTLASVLVLMLGVGTSLAPAAASAADEASRPSATMANVRIAHDAIAKVGKPGWADLLDENVVFEFPYAASIGYPGKIVGKQAVIKYIDGVLKFTHGATMFDITNTPSSVPGTIYNEYKSHYGIAPGVTQTYISIQKIQNGKLVYQKEFWDPTPYIKIQKDMAKR